MYSQALLTDLYQLTMMQALFKEGKHRQRCVFDRFYRSNPFGGNYTMVAGLSTVIQYVKDFRFTEEDLAYLESTHLFCPEFLAYLKDFRFTSSIYAMPEGTLAFPREVLMRIEGPKDEALLLETPLSMFLNHETLIATKARRIWSVVKGDMLAEFGLRRAQGASASIRGARASIIGGFKGTSNVYAAASFGIKPIGTMAHSWVMSFPSEIEAFRAYARSYEHALVLLVDTYDTLHKGVPAAIEIFKEVKERRGGSMPEGYGINLDSGDLAYLSREARRMLDEAGFTDAKIYASNDLDEYTIEALKDQGAAITVWGVGTKLITADGTPALGGVYKLAGQWEGEDFVPKMKFSDSPEKITNPGRKKVLRLIDKETGKLIGDVVCFIDEFIDENKPYTFINPQYPWKHMHLDDGSFTVVDLLKPIFIDGELVYDEPTLMETQAYGDSQMALLWPQYTRLMNPEIVKVNPSERLYELRQRLQLEAVGRK